MQSSQLDNSKNHVMYLIGLIVLIAFVLIALFVLFGKGKEKSDFIIADKIMPLARENIKAALRDVEILDLDVTYPSILHVNYNYDKLFDVNVKYKTNNKIKSMTLPYGYIKGNWIKPSNTDIVIADDKANAIRTLEPNKE